MSFLNLVKVKSIIGDIEEWRIFLGYSSGSQSVVREPSGVHSLEF